MADYSLLDDVFQWRDSVTQPDLDEPPGWSPDQPGKALLTLDQISGLSHPVEFEDCVIRPLTEHDIQEIRATEEERLRFPTISPWYDLRGEPLPLVVDIPLPTGPFDVALHHADGVRRKLESALRLIIPAGTFALHPPLIYQTSVKGSLTGQYFLRPIHPSLSKEPGIEPHNLDQTDTTDLKEYYTRQAQLTDPRVRLALRRFNTTYQRYELEDALIDCWIALEAMFSEGPSDIRFKAAMRIAYYVNPSDREELFNELYESYAVRNALVHGVTKDLNVKPARISALWALWLSLRRAIPENSRPDLESLNKLIAKGG